MRFASLIDLVKKKVSEEIVTTYNITNRPRVTSPISYYFRFRAGNRANSPSAFQRQSGDSKSKTIIEHSSSSQSRTYQKEIINFEELVSTKNKVSVSISDPNLNKDDLMHLYKRRMRYYSIP